MASHPAAFSVRSWLVGIGLAAAGLAQDPARTSAVAVSTTTVAAAHDQTLAVLWMQRSAEYRAACLQAFRQAAPHLDQAMDDLGWTACLEQAERGNFADLPPAIVVDVDETVLDNSVFAARQIRAGVTKFDPTAWSQWVHEQAATPVPGSLAYLNAAAARGVRIVYITNRNADGTTNGVTSTEETDTRANLRRLGFPLVEDREAGEDVVLTAGEHGDKAVRRRLVAERFRILQLFGDNLGDFAPATDPRKGQPDAAAEAASTERHRRNLVDDFAEHWGTRWILLPNPAYGGFEGVVVKQFGSAAGGLRAQ